MTLNEYLSLSGESVGSFSERSGLAPSTVSRLRHGRRRPTLYQVEKIEAATSGKVRAQDFYGMSLSARPLKRAKSAKPADMPRLCRTSR
ncbi:MAG: XRE family transcriptional regulator [Acidiphilium sp.]|nr:XRE family transcriptional regulator [Acidiphilium sp.]